MDDFPASLWRGSLWVSPAQPALRWPGTCSLCSLLCAFAAVKTNGRLPRKAGLFGRPPARGSGWARPDVMPIACDPRGREASAFRTNTTNGLERAREGARTGSPSQALPVICTQQTLNPHNGKRGDCLPPARCSAHTTLMILVGAECPHVQPLPRRPADGGHRAPRQLGHLGAVTASRSAWRLTQGHSELFAQTEGHLLLIICSLGFENENSPSKFFDRKRTKKKHKSMGKTPDH